MIFLQIYAATYGVARSETEKPWLVSETLLSHDLVVFNTETLGGRKAAVCFADVERDTYVRLPRVSDVLALCQYNDVSHQCTIIFCLKSITHAVL